MEAIEPNEWSSYIPDNNIRVEQDASDLKLEEVELISSSTLLQPYESGYVGNIRSAMTVQERTDQELMHQSYTQLMRYHFHQYDIEFVTEPQVSQDELVVNATDWKMLDQHKHKHAENGRQMGMSIITVALAIGALLIVFFDCSKR